MSVTNMRAVTVGQLLYLLGNMPKDLPVMLADWSEFVEVPCPLQVTEVQIFDNKQLYIRHQKLVKPDKMVMLGYY